MLEIEWAKHMAEMVEAQSHGLGGSMEKLALLQPRLNQLSLHAKVAKVKLAAFNDVGPKGPYKPAEDDEGEDDEYGFSETDAGYGPKGTVRSTSDTPAFEEPMAAAGTPFGPLPGVN